MKVIQLNIWFGHLLHPALAFIDKESPDVLCAQEVYSSEIGYPLFAEYQTHQQLAERFPYSFFASTFSIQVGGETVEYGNAIYSKYPISEQQVDFTHGEYATNQTFKAFKRNIRNLQQCKVTLPGGKTVTIANHHGYHDLNFMGTEEAFASMQKVAAIFQTTAKPVIFCGDLNLDPTSKAVEMLDSLGMRNLTTEHKLQTTLSSAHRFTEKLTCDYIYVSPEVAVNDFYADDAVVSDHKALVLDAEI